MRTHLARRTHVRMLIVAVSVCGLVACEPSAQDAPHPSKNAADPTNPQLPEGSTGLGGKKEREEDTRK